MFFLLFLRSFTSHMFVFFVGLVNTNGMSISVVYWSRSVSSAFTNHQQVVSGYNEKPAAMDWG